MPVIPNGLSLLETVDYHKTDWGKIAIFLARSWNPVSQRLPPEVHRRLPSQFRDYFSGVRLNFLRSIWLSFLDLNAYKLADNSYLESILARSTLLQSFLFSCLFFEVLHQTSRSIEAQC